MRGPEHSSWEESIWGSKSQGRGIDKRARLVTNWPLHGLEVDGYLKIMSLKIMHQGLQVLLCGRGPGDHGPGTGLDPYQHTRTPNNKQHHRQQNFINSFRLFNTKMTFYGPIDCKHCARYQALALD